MMMGRGLHKVLFLRPRITCRSCDSPALSMTTSESEGWGGTWMRWYLRLVSHRTTASLVFVRRRSCGSPRTLSTLHLATPTAPAAGAQRLFHRSKSAGLCLHSSHGPAPGARRTSPLMTGGTAVRGQLPQHDRSHNSAQADLPLRSDASVVLWEMEAACTAFNKPRSCPETHISHLSNVPQVCHPDTVTASDFRKPSAVGLHIETDLSRLTAQNLHTVIAQDASCAQSKPYPGAMSTTTTPAMKTSRSTASLTSSLSPMSTMTMNSPALGLVEMTPLPSPIAPGESPGPWKRVFSREQREFVIGSTDEASPLASKVLAPTKRKSYQTLVSAPQEVWSTNRIPSDNAGRARNRSLSAFAPTALQASGLRIVNLPGGNTPKAGRETDFTLHREEYLGDQRGLSTNATPTALRPSMLPTPPASDRHVSVSASDAGSLTSEDAPPTEMAVRDSRTKKVSMWKQLRILGQGTFSRVVLAYPSSSGEPATPKEENVVDPKTLVAIKIIEHGPAGGADEERVENQLKREIELLRAIDQPSIVHLKDCEIDEKRALLVLGYASGGDLFEFASERLDLLSPELIQRIFAELVDAVRYLHHKFIVHRDIKLESE